MVDLILRAKVILKDGQKRLIFEKPDFYKEQINQFFEGTNIEVSIKRKSGRRTSQQNKFWHGVCFPTIAELTGYTVNEAKALCKKLFCPVKILQVKKFEIEIQKGTSDLDKMEGMDFTKQVMNLAVDLGGRILSPCEAGYNCGNKTCLICNPAEDKKIEYPEGQEEITAF